MAGLFSRRGSGARHLNNQGAYSGQAIKQGLFSMHPMDKAALATAPIPGVGDVVGLMADMRTLYNEPSLSNAGFAALGALPFVPSLGMVKAFHGTPHKVDKFSMDKIGTGEGAQVYGHGLYFAESPDVANQYQKALSIKDEIYLNGNRLKNQTDSFANSLRNIVRNTNKGMDFDQAKQIEIDMLNITKNPLDKQAAEDIYNLSSSQLTTAGGGNLYQVDLNVEPEDLLDWDAPIKDQSSSVKDAVSKSMAQQAGVTPDKENYDSMVSLIRRQLDNSEMTGAEAYKANWADPVESSARFKELGIPGIQYFDGMSRNAGKGTRNYVMFDDSLIGTPKPYGAVD